MLSFATEFPVNRVHGSQDFLNAVRTWILGSPHTEFSAVELANIPNSGEWSARKAHETVNTLLWSSPDEMLAGARWLLTADDLDWETSVVFRAPNLMLGSAFEPRENRRTQRLGFHQPKSQLLCVLF